MLASPYDTAFVREVLENRRAFPRFRFLLGGGGLGERHARSIQAFCSQLQCHYLGVYGQTEVTGVATTVYEDECQSHPASCGRPVRDMQLQIWGGSGQPLPVGEVGEIMIRGPRCVPGYWDDAQASQQLYSGDWLHTGDLGRLDAEGYLYIAGRKKELIKTGGENVYPREVEEVLAALPEIRDVVVLGTPDPQWGEAVTAAVVPRNDASVTLAAVREFCRGRIAGYKIPKKLIVLDAIPRNHTGKPLKREIREWATRGEEPFRGDI
jgi:fatty-acyl-CoA synthase